MFQRFAILLCAVVLGCAAVFLFLRKEKTAKNVAPTILFPVGPTVHIPAPLGLPAVPVPADNPPTAETIALGRRLFYDTILSADNTVSCSTCHNPAHGFSDIRPVSLGIQQKAGTRNSLTALNAAYFQQEFWDGRAASLEAQVEGPVQNPVEMGETFRGVEKKLNADPSYRAQFAQAWGARPIQFQMVEKSIASFERTLLSGNSSFDRWKYGHDESAVSAAVKRGFAVFTAKDKGNCASCHSVGANDALFTDNKFHNIGVGVDFGKFKDDGVFAVTHNAVDRGKFKTPSLRDIALTAPYMHDGSMKTLKEVMDFYIGGGNSNPNLDSEVHKLDFLTRQERSDLLEFLNSLTGEVPPNSGPPPAESMTASK